MLQMKEAVNEEHEGKRKAELTWKINRIHWEKNRFIYDLMYQRKVLSRELVSSTGHLDISCQGCSLGSVYPNALACPCCVTQCADRPGSIKGRTCMQDMRSCLHRLPCAVMASYACSTAEALRLPLCTLVLTPPCCMTASTSLCL